MISQKRPTKRAPDARDSGAIPNIFLRLSIFLVGRRSAARPSAGNANRWVLSSEEYMKNRNSFVIIPFLLALVGCVPVVTPASPIIPYLTAISTSTPTYDPTPTMPHIDFPTTAPFTSDFESKDCFFNINFISEKTEMNEVVSFWGNPTSKVSYGVYDDWSYDIPGIPSFNFKNQILQRVVIYLKDCSLKKIITKLGQPEKVEITVLVSDIDFSEDIIQDFHYPSLGFSFYRVCVEYPNCFTFHPNDYVNGKKFYLTSKVIEDSTGFNTARYVYNWHGFGVDVEKTENKIKDFATITPTP